MAKNLLTRFIVVFIVLVSSALLAFPLEKRINLGLDLQGGMYLVMRVDTSQLDEDAQKDAVERAVEKLRNRIDQFGVREPIIQIQGEEQIVIQLPGKIDRDVVLEKISQTAFLEFKLVSDDRQLIAEALEGNVPDGYEFLEEDEGRGKILLKKKAELTGDELETADVRFDQQAFGQPIVAMTLKPDGVKTFAQLTKDNIGRRLAIVVDGNVYSAPVIKNSIPNGEAIISGRFTNNEAKDLAIALRTALPAPLIIEEERTVGPLLGQDSIRKGIAACAVGMFLVFFFMAFYYGFSGMVANLALVLNILIILGGMSLVPGATLTLPGIAGILLTMGMAVDANVLINERMREELRSGKTLRMAVSQGYDKAFRAILDANVTTLIAAFFLGQFGTGPIRGFAVTLIIGILASLFTAVVVTRLIFETLMFKRWMKGLRFRSFFKPERTIDFLNKRFVAAVLSGILLVAGVWALAAKKQDAYGVEFTGGQVQEYMFREPVAIGDLRGALKEGAMDDVKIQQVADEPREIILRGGEDTASSVQKALRTAFPGNPFEIMRIEKIGPSVGALLRQKAVFAILYSLLGILLYVTIRFRHFDFAVGGVVALLHDVFLTLGFVVLMGRQVDLLVVTALLTIAGYSINDTIIIYDRVRELMRLKHRASLREVINMAINQTLPRTVLTTVTTLIVALCMYILGGSILNTFALALLFGFTIGCYSTIFVASPIVLACHNLMKSGRRR